MNQVPPQMTQEKGGNMKWGIIVVGVILLGVALWWYMQKGTQPEASAPVSNEQSTPTTSTQSPQATGNVDDITNALLSAQAEEALTANAGDSDISLVTSDADAVSGMNTLYNDNEF